MRLYTVLLFLVDLQTRNVSGLAQPDDVLAFLTSNSNLISASQFDFIFFSNQETVDPISRLSVLVSDKPEFSVAAMTLTENSNIASILEMLLTDCRANVWLTRKVIIFNLTLLLTADEEVTEIFSTINSIPCKSEFIFIILWPHSLNQAIEIPKLIRPTTNSSGPTFSWFIDLTSDVYLLHDDNKYGFMLTELYQVKSSAPIILTNITEDASDGIMKTDEAVILYELLRKAHRRNNFNGVEIRGAAVDEPDFEYESVMSFSETKKELQFISGEAVGIYHILRDATKFKEKAVLGTDYVYPFSNGSLGGMGAQILSGEIDIAISFSEIVSFRLRQLQFLHPVSDERMYVYFRQPASNAFRDIYLQAFSPMLWLVYLILWFVLCASMVLFVWVKTHIEKVSVEEDLDLVYEYVLWAVASVSQQGWYAVPRSISVKMAALTGMATGFILYTAFCGSLVSILSLPVLSIKSFQNILDHKYTIYGEHLSLAVREMLKDLSGKKYNEHFDEKNLINPHDAMTKLMSESKAAFISPVYSFYLPLFRSGSYTENSVCSYITAIPLSVSPARAGMFVRKGSPFKDIFNAKILHILETGIRRRLIRRYKEQQSFTCMKTDDTTTPKDPMQIKDVFTAIAILIMGFISSTVIFLIEKLTQHIKPTNMDHLAKAKMKLKLADVDLGFCE